MKDVHTMDKILGKFQTFRNYFIITNERFEVNVVLMETTNLLSRFIES